MNAHIPNARKRSYDDGCAVAQIMDVIGERWALLVMRELLFGPRRFSDLRARLPGISANMLTQRLNGLEGAGVLVRRKLPPPASVTVYELTPWGYECEPLFRVIGRWAARSPFLCPAPMSVASMILSMRTMFSPERAGDLRASIGFVLNGESFLMRIGGGQMEVEPGEAAGADIILRAQSDALAELLYARRPVAELEGEERLRVDGDRALLPRFLTLFPLPDPAPMPGGREGV